MLVLRDVRKQYERLVAVDGVSFAVSAGQIVGLIGPNGSGKSTLLHLIAGTQRADGGSVEFDGQRISDMRPEQIFHLGLARSFQDPSLFFRMTVLDNTLLPVKGQRGERTRLAPFPRLWADEERRHAEASRRVLEHVQLDRQYDRLASDLSGGQMKLLELGRSLMGAPRMLLLDEPTAGVAPALAYTIFEQIARMRREQAMTFLIVEHRLEILFDFADHIVVMHLGQVIAQGAPQEIAANARVREIYFGE
jgi:branched-chain amino acid transport system ATP-binding protein